MEDICGIPAEELRAAARTFANGKAGMIFWGMGVSQHIHGTDNSRCLISLALMTGTLANLVRVCIHCVGKTMFRVPLMRV